MNIQSQYGLNAAAGAMPHVEGHLVKCATESETRDPSQRYRYLAFMVNGAIPPFVGNEREPELLSVAVLGYN